jgi:hypothetical protein
LNDGTDSDDRIRDDSAYRRTGRIASQEGDSPYTTGDFVAIIVDKETGAAEEFAYSEL